MGKRVQYIENFDPGFKELGVEDLAPILQQDTPEQSQLRNSLIILINAEYDRLRLDNDCQEYLQHMHGVSQLKTAPLFELKLYSDYLKTLERK